MILAESALRNARLAGVFFLAAWLGGCAIVLPQTSGLRDTWPAGLAEKAELADVPFFPQEDYQCGPAALATIMAYAGEKVVPDDLVPEVYIPARKGSLQVEMLAAPRRHRLVSYALAPKLEDVLREVSAGTPVILLHGYGVWPLKYWHYAVVVGFDRERGEAILRSGMKERMTMPFAVLEYTWKESAHWAMVTNRPERIPTTASEETYLDALNAMARVADAPTAITGYSAFLKRWPGNLTATIGLANALHADGRLAMAETVLRDALAKNPDSAVVMNNLAQTLSDRGRNAEALALVEKALKAGGPFTQALEETRAAIRRRLVR